MIYLLKRTDKIGWDEFEGKIIRAVSEHEARNIANETTGDEGKIWHNSEKVTCEILDVNGISGPLLEAYRAG